MIKDEIGVLFIPVSDIERSRDWYSVLLGKANGGEILFGHLYILPLKGTNIVLDSKIYSKNAIYQIPAFHFNTDNIEEAFKVCEKLGVELISPILNDHYFNCKDPDGNQFMICQC